MKHSPQNVPSHRLLSLAILTTLASSAGATGFRLPDQDAFATARGEAFAATADNPSAIFYNPAGITQLEGQQFRAGVYGIKTDTDFTAPNGQEFDNLHDLHAVPQVFYTLKLEGRPVAFGLGVYSPFGLSNEWPDNTGFRTLGLRGRLTYLTINPVVAWEVVPGLSLAAGPTANFADTDLRQGFATPLPGFGDLFSFEGHGWAAGFNAGLLWKITEQVQIGLNYRSATTVNFKGHTELTAPVNARPPASAEWDFPQNVVAGISYRPTPNWNLEFNVDWTGWDRLNTVQVHQAPLPDAPIVLNWESSFYYEFGATRYLANGWSVSGGYIFNENSVPDANYNPIVADMNRHFWSVGFGHKGERFDFDIAYQFGWGPERTVTGSAPSLAGQTADGRYEFVSHALFVTVGTRF